MTIALTDAEFEAKVTNSDVPVLLDFWAPWCGPCRMLGPIVDEISTQVGASAAIFKINVDENPATAAKFGITSIPTVIIFEKGAVKQQFVGVQPKVKYLQALGL